MKNQYVYTPRRYTIYRETKDESGYGGWGVYGGSTLAQAIAGLERAGYTLKSENCTFTLYDGDTCIGKLSGGLVCA